MRVYVAGPMSGLPDHNLPAFAQAARELNDHGYEAVNPGDRGVIEGYSWRDYMCDAIPLLVTCDAVALLPGWERSKGARLEFTIAHDLDMRTEPVEWFLREKRT